MDFDESFMASQDFEETVSFFTELWKATFILQ